MLGDERFYGRGIIQDAAPQLNIFRPDTRMAPIAERAVRYPEGLLDLFACEQLFHEWMTVRLSFTSVNKVTYI
jgi:hypothetical protein